MSSDFPTSTGALDVLYNQAIDCFVSSFKENDQMNWSTFFGGSSNDWAYSIAADNLNSRIYFVGYTSSTNFPFHDPGNGSNYYYSAIDNGSTGFITCLTNTGDVNQWTTAFHNSFNNSSLLRKVLVDGNSNIYCMGKNAAPTITNPLGAYSQFTGNASSIVEFNSSFAIQWSTFFGGSTGIMGATLTHPIDPSQAELLVAGNTNTTTTTTTPCSTQTNNSNTVFPICNGGGYFQPQFGGGNFDCFIAKFGSSHELNWSTYYGGNNTDYMDDDGLTSNKTYPTDFYNETIFLCGSTTSTNSYSTSDYCNNQNDYNIGGAQNKFPLCHPFQASNAGGGGDGFVAEFNLSTGLEDASYMGTSGGDDCLTMTPDQRSGVFVTGILSASSSSFDVPYADYYDHGYFSDRDAFITNLYKFVPLWSTYYGGESSPCVNPYAPDEVGEGITFNPNNYQLYLVGFTTSSDFPLIYTPLAFHQDLNNDPNYSICNDDAFIVRFDLTDGYIGIDEPLSDGKISVFPNPITSQTNILLNQPRQLHEIKLTDLLGRTMNISIVKQQVHQFSIDLSDMIDGIYLMQLTFDDGKSQTIKIVKQ